MRSIINTFWVPLLLGFGSLGLSLALPSYFETWPTWLVPVTLVGSFGFFVWAGVLAYRTGNSTRGGKGGTASAHGENSDASGGKGGNAGVSNGGGDGGNATARGRGSKARGGDGGAG